MRPGGGVGIWSAKKFCAVFSRPLYSRAAANSENFRRWVHVRLTSPPSISKLPVSKREDLPEMWSERPLFEYHLLKDKRTKKKLATWCCQIWDFQTVLGLAQFCPVKVCLDTVLMQSILALIQCKVSIAFSNVQRLLPGTISWFSGQLQRTIEIQACPTGINYAGKKSIGLKTN